MASQAVSTDGVVIVAFAFANAILLAASNVLSGVAGRTRSAPEVLMIAAPVSLGVALVAAYVAPGEVSGRAFGWGMAAGLIGGTGLLLAVRGLALGPVGAVAATSQATSAGIVTAVGVALVGGISPLRLVGLLLCLFAIGLICLDGGAPASRLRGPAIGVAAGLCFGAFVILVNQAPENAGMSTIVAARVGVCVVVLAASTARLRRRGWIPSQSSGGVGASVGLGIADASANLFLAAALAAGDLVLVALISATAPAIATLLAFAFLKQRITRRQSAGLLLCVAGAAAALA